MLTKDEEKTKRLKMLIPTFFGVMLLVVIVVFLTTESGRFLNSEPKVRGLYNQALLAWSEDNQPKALELLDQIIEQFPNAEITSEAITTRQEYEKIYTVKFSDVENAKKNNHDFSKAVWESVLAYRQEHGQAPATLADTNIGKEEELQKFLTWCQYELSERNKNNVALDCRGANTPFMVFNAETGKYDEYTDYERKNSDARRKEKSKGKPLSEFLKANSTWGETLNKGGKIPEKGFSAFFINTNEPEIVIAKYDSDVIAMNYIYSDFHNIKSEDFGGYWVGYLTVPEEGNYNFYLDQSWAKSRILLDKRIIHQGGGGGKVAFIHLPKGRYLLEFEYINNWHTVGVQLNVAKDVAVLETKDIIPILKNLPVDTAVYAASVYESDQTENQIILDTQKVKTPYVLLLKSYRGVNWKIEGPAPAFVFYEANNGSSVSSSGGEIFPWNGNQIPYNSFILKKNKDCHCVAGHFSCDSDSSLQQSIDFVEKVTGRQLIGGSGIYSTSKLMLPEVLVTEQSLNTEKLNIEQREKERKACVKKASPSFENIMQLKS